MTTLGALRHVVHHRVHHGVRERAHRFAARPVRADALIAAVILGVTLVTATSGPQARPLSPLALASAVVAGAVLVLRRRYPFATLLVSAFAAEVFLAHHDGRNGLLLLAAPLVALSTVAERATRMRAVLVGGLVVLAIGVTHVWLKPALLGAENLALAAFGGLAVAAGTASRHRHAFLAEARKRADRAEADRDAEARRRVTEERLRIARDLHDVIGHHLALIHIQARVAAHAIDNAGSPAAQALDHVCAASKAALTDLGDTIGLLRQDGDPADPTAPVCGLDRVEDLLAAYRRSGLDIAVTATGAVRALPGPADLTAYRVLQESLTNVCKHVGPTSVAVTLAYRDDGLELTVENPTTGAVPGLPGHGHVGMRERVGALGGTFTAGPVADAASGRYRVTARLPYAA
jgi:signal transduction histidine kinase